MRPNEPEDAHLVQNEADGDEVPEEVGWREALNEVGKRHMARGGAMWLFIAIVYGLSDLFIPRLFFEISVVLGILITIGGVLLVFPAAVQERVMESRRAKRRAELTRAAAKSGVRPSQTTRGERVRQWVSDSLRNLVGAAIIEAIVVTPFALNTHKFFYYGSIDWSFVAFAATMILLLPLYIAYSFWSDLRNTESSTVAMARAERAYREATKGKEDLSGALVLDEHASRQVGGELTVQQEAGGLEVHEEVALGLDEGSTHAADEVVEVMHGWKRT